MKNIIARRVNQLLPVEYLKSVLETLIANRPLKLLRFIAQTGRSKVAWIYVENTLDNSRYSTFVSFADLLDSFLCWLETAQIALMAFWHKAVISKIVNPFYAVGDCVYTPGWGIVEILDKDSTHNGFVPRLWIETEDTIEKIMPCEVCQNITKISLDRSV